MVDMDDMKRVKSATRRARLFCHVVVGRCLVS
jgi:hypothetical protein